MLRIGVTGQSGFIGAHLASTILLDKDKYELIPFEKTFFESSLRLDEFISKCDVLVHLAGLNRHEDPEYIYQINVGLVNKLIESLDRTQSKAHVIFSSSLQEELDNKYGKSKKEGRQLFQQWANLRGNKFTALIIPNIFGPFCKPFYNSFVATFCHQLTHGQTPSIQNNSYVKLLHVGDLVGEILEIINKNESNPSYYVPENSTSTVEDILNKLIEYKNLYLERGEIPRLESKFEVNLFNTFRSYIEHKDFFPVFLKKNIDNRGLFSEVIRLGIGGQCSFSTTVPNITRGNHYHTRKIERFTVIKGKALIQIRKIGTNEVHDFILDGNDPAYVDMPVWYTHNIKNIGEEELYTLFWINEPYDANDPDTWIENV
jgi:UDP-2-acetamido-2,6-beta-L-arabino-hexul-4-ose reductase